MRIAIASEFPLVQDRALGGLEAVVRGLAGSIARDPAHVSLLEDSGGVCISAPYTTAAMVENHLDRPGIAEMFEMEGGVVSLIDVWVPAGAEVVGRRIQDIRMPEESVVAAIVRNGQFVVPRGGTAIEAGDHVVLSGTSSAVQAAHGVFVDPGAE